MARNWKDEYQKQKARNKKDGGKTHYARMERQRARRKYDAAGIDRSGMDIHHPKPLSQGGSNKTGTKLTSVKSNRAQGGAMSKPPKKRT